LILLILFHAIPCHCDVIDRPVMISSYQQIFESMLRMAQHSQLPMIIVPKKDVITINPCSKNKTMTLVRKGERD
jgi:hypothetical protein